MNEFTHTAIYWYLAIINGAAFAIYGWDKFCAVRHRWRVPEKTLLILAAAGGSIGALLAMEILRHKTQHLKFKYGVPVILLLQLAAVFYVHLR